MREVFVRLYEEGLVYRGERIINWCPRCMSSISDLEVEVEDTPGKLYYVRYPIEPLEGESGAAVHHRRHHAPGDHPGRYRRGRQSRRRALSAIWSGALPSCPSRAAHPDRRATTPSSRSSARAR